jgi:hypothetical protein
MDYPRTPPAPNPPRTFRRGLADESRASDAARRSRTSGWCTCTPALMWPSRRPGVGRVPGVGSGRATSMSGRPPAEISNPASPRHSGSKLSRSAACSSSASPGMGSAAIVAIVAVVATGGRESVRASFKCPDRRLQGDPARASPRSRVPHRAVVRTDTGALLSAGEVWRAIRPGNP